MNLLANLSQGVLGYGITTLPTESMLDWLGEVIRWLIEGVGVIGVGIIIFTLILKTIVLPLDIYSRIKSKKQALVMEKMRPQMEKLQKQYANEKQLYQQKVLELQKKSGYSMFGACVPMIVSLIIFIIVFQAFSAYSQYATVESYNDMVRSYNSVVERYELTEENSEGFLQKVYYSEDGSWTVYSGEEAPAEGAASDYKVDFSAFAKAYNKQNNLALTEEGVYSALVKQYSEETGTVIAQGAENSSDASTREAVRMTLVSYVIDGYAAQKVADDYISKQQSGEGSGFLWVKNIWYPDSVLSREVPDFSTFRQAASRLNIDAGYEESYNKVTADLVQQKEQYNGYFILIILSIGVMLLQQFIAMRSNKATNELSSVDGSAQRTTKMMMIMMPIIYGLFAFMYSSAFSIYMITNTIYSIITTLIINKAMNVWFSRREERTEHDRMAKRGK